MNKEKLLKEALLWEKGDCDPEYDQFVELYQEFLDTKTRKEALEALAWLDLEYCIQAIQLIGKIPPPVNYCSTIDYDTLFLWKQLPTKGGIKTRTLLLQSIASRIRFHAHSYGFRDIDLDAAWMKAYNKLELI